MRILILGHYEIASNYAISLLVNGIINSGLNLDVRVALSGKGDSKLESQTSARNNFVQLANYERQLCDALEADEDHLDLGCDSFSRMASKTGKSIDLLLNPNSEMGLRQLRSWSPDLIISIRYRKIFHVEAIAIPTHGIINLHSGLLPQYRGAMATFWSMLNSESVYGSTLHFITDKSIDTGAIIVRKSRILDCSKSYLKNVLELYPEGVEAILNALRSFRCGTQIDVQMPENRGIYYSFPGLEELELFKKMALSLY